MGDGIIEMKEVPVDDSIREIWKKYPLRISGLKDSRCHGKPTVLVQSMDGGFVTRNCPECGGYESLSETDFHLLGLWVACPDCRQPMTSRTGTHSELRLRLRTVPELY